MAEVFAGGLLTLLGAFLGWWLNRLDRQRQRQEAIEDAQNQLRVEVYARLLAADRQLGYSKALMDGYMKAGVLSGQVEKLGEAMSTFETCYSEAVLVSRDENVHKALNVLRKAILTEVGMDPNDSESLDVSAQVARGVFIVVAKIELGIETKSAAA